MTDERKDQSKLREYLEGIYSQKNSELFLQARKWSDQLGHSGMSLSSIEGRILTFLVRMNRCKKFVEIGTLTGYSALWILSGMEEGSLYTLERDETHYKAAKSTLDQWRGRPQVHQLLGDARENLSQLSSHHPFDGIFIDADKSSYGLYLDWAESNLRTGGLIIADNSLLDGYVYDELAKTSFSQTQKKAMLEFNQRLANSEKFDSVIIPTFAGMTVAIKKF